MATGTTPSINLMKNKWSFDNRVEALARAMKANKKEALRRLYSHIITNDEISIRFYVQLYAITDNMGNVKLGQSRDVARRLAGLQTCAPVKLELLGHTALSPGLEFGLHKALKKYRVRGEWFRMEGDVLKVVELIKQKKTRELCDFAMVEFWLAIPEGIMLDDEFWLGNFLD